MLGWLYLIVSGAAVALAWGVLPRPVLFMALLVFGASFATFCLLYDAPVNRARMRIAGRMAQLSSKGANAEEFQRLQSMTAKPTEDDKRFRLSFLSGVNIATGVAGAGLLIWAVMVRMM